MASIRPPRTLKNGTRVWDVNYRIDGRQSSTTWESESEAEAFKVAVNVHGAARACELYKIDPNPRSAPQLALSVAGWIRHHIDHLTGVEPGTIASYERYLKNDIAPSIGELPLTALTHDDVARWVQAMEEDFAPKTIANKHGFLSGALASAVRANKIPANPADGTRLPSGERKEMVFLSREEFAHLQSAVPDQWKPLVEFLVASGARWSEVTALKPSDVDRTAETVRIVRAWKKGKDTPGPPKTKKSRRTINVPATVLDKLDYTGEWLFTKPGRGGHSKDGPVRGQSFRINVWNPAVARAELDPRPRIHDMRHTCASWLIQADVPLPVIQQHLGHESIQTTVDIYGHIDRRSAKAAAKAIGKALKRAG
ncbi:tyrosine-type recombinase/integrase [Mycobacteroides abscessus]|uniref:tyrosine-type recombinase/integrase n=1 Tax=Mycobacteroides abscessus TaxID=36809 RepID=UPI0021064828|nr:site-specific integrase [Mycobacteroides abscessus]